MSGSKDCFIILLVTGLIQIRSFTILLLFTGETGEVSVQISLFRDLVGDLRIIVQIRSDRHIAGQINILAPRPGQRLRSWTFPSELSFQVSCTKRQ